MLDTRDGDVLPLLPLEHEIEYKQRLVPEHLREGQT
jgi:hypothetical protein